MIWINLIWYLTFSETIIYTLTVWCILHCLHKNKYLNIRKRPFFGSQKAFHHCSIECHGVWNHQLFECLFNSLCRSTSKKLSKFHITGPSLRGIHHSRIPLIKGQWCGKCFHAITSSWYLIFMGIRCPLWLEWSYWIITQINWLNITTYDPCSWL